MDATEAILAVLSSEPGSEMHWTVIWDRALRAGHIDPLADPEAREGFLRALAAAARTGLIEKTSTGTYRLPATGR